MAEPPQTIMEEREDLMVSPQGGKPRKKMAHFIKPILGLGHSTPERPFISLPMRPIYPKVTFNGWRSPTEQWVSWVDNLHSSYQYIWKNAGIYEAILSSRYKIIKDEDLFFGLAERWCSETNTFVFPWGEASLTLEDVMVLGGFSVLGDFVSGSVKDDHEFVEIEKNLINAYQEILRGKSQKVIQSLWMKRFMGSNSRVEHEAFLSLWLSRFVLPTYPVDTIAKRFFKIAIYLARGTQIALAPVVLTSIYRDLTLLKPVIESGDQVKEVDIRGDHINPNDLLVVTLWAPLQLVQVWAWERFPLFRSNPNTIEYGEPRLARWHVVKGDEMGNVRPMLQSAGHTFEWRPYCNKVDNLPLPTFYEDNEVYVLVDSDMGQDYRAMALFLRVCELVGMDSIEQYNPHRVAMQFGFDQDVPNHVRRCLVDPHIPKTELMELAWLDYISPIKDQTLYVPSKCCEPQVTARYLAWHRQGNLTRQAIIKGVKRKRRSSKGLRRLPRVKVETASDMTVIPSSFHLTSNVDKDNVDVRPGFQPKYAGNDADVPPGFRPKSSDVAKISMVKVKEEFVESTENGKPWGSERGSECSNAEIITPTLEPGKGGQVKDRWPHERLELELKARISKLERIVAALKEAKYRLN